MSIVRIKDDDLLRSEAERDAYYAFRRMKELLWLGGLRLPTPREWPYLDFDMPKPAEMPILVDSRGNLFRVTKG